MDPVNPAAIFDQAIALIDAANSADPNQEAADGQAWPKELLYSRRMSDMLQRYAPAADDAMRLAIRAQHVQRWQSPRDAYPTGRDGYLQWRKDLYTFHADTAAGLLAQAGYGADVIERVRKAVGKRALKKNPDSQLLEDVTALVFLEHYMLDFAARHPEYDEEKWRGIIRKTWEKMSRPARDFALAGGIRLPETLAPLILKSIAAD
jgi:hypothetical protein